MKNYLDYKAIVWVRVPIDKEENIPKIIESLETANGDPEYLDEVLFNDEENTHMTFDYLYDTPVYLPIEDNQGNATIEIFKDSKQVWNNGKE